jgi:hypothetical protein
MVRDGEVWAHGGLWRLAAAATARAVRLVIGTTDRGWHPLLGRRMLYCVLRRRKAHAHPGLPAPAPRRPSISAPRRTIDPNAGTDACHSPSVARPARRRSVRGDPARAVWRNHFGGRGVPNAYRHPSGNRPVGPLSAAARAQASGRSATTHPLSSRRTRDKSRPVGRARGRSPHIDSRVRSGRWETTRRRVVGP